MTGLRYLPGKRARIGDCGEICEISLFTTKGGSGRITTVAFEGNKSEWWNGRHASLRC